MMLEIVEPLLGLLFRLAPRRAEKRCPAETVPFGVYVRSEGEVSGVAQRVRCV
jgi:hypothetical protein